MRISKYSVILFQSESEHSWDNTDKRSDHYPAPIYTPHMRIDCKSLHTKQCPYKLSVTLHLILKTGPCCHLPAALQAKQAKQGICSRAAFAMTHTHCPGTSQPGSTWSWDTWNPPAWTGILPSSWHSRIALGSRRHSGPSSALGMGCCVSQDAHHKMAGYTAQFILGWERGGGEWRSIFQTLNALCLSGHILILPY